MMNFKTLIISTSLSVFFGIYSIYGLMLYLEKLYESEKYYKSEIDTLKKAIININNKYDETNKKYNETNKKYYNLLIDFQKINRDINTLSNNITNLETNKIELINCVSSSMYDTSLEDIMEDITDKNNVICNAKLETPKINIGLINLINHNNEELTKDVEELRKVKENVPIIVKNDNMYNIVLENDNGFEILENAHSNNEHIIKSRSRGTSISEINWAEVTKKFIFG